MEVCPLSWADTMPWTETRGICCVGEWTPCHPPPPLSRYERIKVAFEGLTQGIGEKVSLDQLTKVRHVIPRGLVSTCVVSR